MILAICMASVASFESRKRSMENSASVPKTMSAVCLTGHGGFEALEYRDDVPVPSIGEGEVLIKVLAAGMNNTDINTRVGWYSKAVDNSTGEGGKLGFSHADSRDSSWSGLPLSFPRIQGADCCGRIVQAGLGVSAERVGERVIVRTMQAANSDSKPFECWTLGSECDGAFAQFMKACASETFAVDCGLSDEELAAIPCAYSTAENMLCRSNIGAERIIVAGASGGVGSAAVQLAKRRGAEVIAVSSRRKAQAVKDIGADAVISSEDDLQALSAESIDAVVDVVAGRSWKLYFDLLKRGGRYVVAGAIAGPIVELDLRTIYLKDLTILGCTFQDDEVFKNLVGYVERGEIRPVVAKTYPLADIVAAQNDFLSKKFMGKLVLMPPR